MVDVSDRLILRNIGQIDEADITFGDLTVFVGPQATGKSIALQFLKLVEDLGYVQERMQTYGLDWDKRLGEFLEVYFGEGMQSLWQSGRSEVHWRQRPLDLDRMVQRVRKAKEESVFLVPAQRVLTMRDGWPRPFTDYAPGDPFAVRDFSEKLRWLVEHEFKGGESLFPQGRRLKREFRELLTETMFRTAELGIDKLRQQKRLVLRFEGGKLPFMVWSAGQREFIPLLLGLYQLMPPSAVSTRADIRWAIIEEPEMGLHPQAIKVLLLMVLDLLKRGYRVCLSTHAPQVLELVWAIRQLQEAQASAGAYLDVFGAPKTAPLLQVAEQTKAKACRVYYFDPKQRRANDISDLDLEHESDGLGGWGGLSEFSSRVNAVVADALANSSG